MRVYKHTVCRLNTENLQKFKGQDPGVVCLSLGAMAAFKRIVLQCPDCLGSRSYLASIYSELGREEEARAEAAEILRVAPNFSLEVWRQRAPYKDPAVLERDLAALRKAGLE